MVTSEEEHIRRMKLYREGKTDQEMSAICFVCVNAIKYWRCSFEPALPPNTPKCERFVTRAKLYEMGLTDKEMAVAQGCSRMAIRDWRKKRGLPQNEKTIKAVLICASN